MLIIKDNPVGVDFEIQKLQTWLYEELSLKGWVNYQSYGRAYKNRRGKNKLPEIYRKTSNGNSDYVEVLLNDKKGVNSFFLCDDVETFDKSSEINVSLIYQANIESLFPNVDHRPDEEFRNVLKALLKQNLFGFTLVKITTGIEKVYSDLKIEIDPNDDMNPYHVVKFDFVLSYYIKNCY